MTVTVESLTKLHYFTGMPPEQLTHLVHLFSERTFLKGQTVFAEGDINDSLHFVAYGVVKVFKTSLEGKEQIIKLVRPGASFNDLAVFSSGPCPWSAQALGGTTIYIIDKRDMLPIMKADWTVALNVITSVAEQSRLLLNLIADLSFKNVTGRLAKILLENSSPRPDGFPRLTQYEMAAMAGTAREVVGRSLKTLEENGAIKLERHRIVITDKEYLGQLAGLE